MATIRRMVIAKLPEANVFLFRPLFFSKTHCQHRDGPFWAMAQISRLFEFDCLVLPGFIKRRSPNLVRGLVLSTAKTKRGSKAQVEIAHVLQDVDQLLGIELRSSTFKRLDQDVCRNIALERHVIRRLAGKIFGQGILVFENNGRVAGNRRHDLRHDSAGGVARSQQHQFISERGAADE